MQMKKLMMAFFILKIVKLLFDGSELDQLKKISTLLCNFEVKKIIMQKQEKISKYQAEKGEQKWEKLFIFKT